MILSAKDIEVKKTENIVEIGKEAMLSSEHLIKTPDGWIKAKDLKVGDKIFDEKDNIISITKII